MRRVIVVFGMVFFMLLVFNIQNTVADVIHACVHQTNGKVRIVSGPGDCKNPEGYMTWFEQGPQGDPGPPGPTGTDGATGQDGLNCWDLDSDFVCDMVEDINLDGICDPLDCQGAEGPPGPQGPPGVDGSCNCPITQEQLDDLIARIEYLENNFDLPRFHDMGDGTIRDNDTGLIWLKNANCFGHITWPAAMNSAASLASGQCGLNDGSTVGDWRLPTIEEWETFMSTVYDQPSLVNTVGDAQWSEGDAFTAVQSHGYWSSTQDSTRTNYAWIANMGGGNTGSVHIYTSFYVWPVRSE